MIPNRPGGGAFGGEEGLGCRNALVDEGPGGRRNRDVPRLPVPAVSGALSGSASQGIGGGELPLHVWFGARSAGVQQAALAGGDSARGTPDRVGLPRRQILPLHPHRMRHQGPGNLSTFEHSNETAERTATPQRTGGLLSLGRGKYSVRKSQSGTPRSP